MSIMRVKPSGTIFEIFMLAGMRYCCRKTKHWRAAAKGSVVPKGVEHSGQGEPGVRAGVAKGQIQRRPRCSIRIEWGDAIGFAIDLPRDNHCTGLAALAPAAPLTASERTPLARMLPTVMGPR